MGREQSFDDDMRTERLRDQLPQETSDFTTVLDQGLTCWDPAGPAGHDYPSTEH